jgi:hypothetical protein
MRAAVAGMGLVLMLTGCSALDGIRRPPPALPPPSPPATVAFEERSAVVPVPAGYRQSTVEFAGASEGAALFTRCAVPHRRVGNHNECSAVWRLVATGWQRLRPQNAPATYRSTAALGGGALAVTSPGQTGLVTLDGRYHATGWPGGGWLQALGDGTLFIDDDLRGELWLGSARARNAGGSRSSSRIRSRSCFGVLELSGIGST